METKILYEAKQDIPNYFKDFKNFWDSSVKSFTDKELIRLYGSTLIFKNWLLCLNHISIRALDEILKEIHEDINQAFYSALMGHYRTSHMHLRSVIELSLQLIYFHQHEVEYQQWKKGEFRIKHEELTSYLKKHPRLNNVAGKPLIDEITKNWKHFSKHIHAEAPKYFQTLTQTAQLKKISKRDIAIWKSNFIRTGHFVNRLLLLFFKQDINRFPSRNIEFLLHHLKPSERGHLGLRG